MYMNQNIIFCLKYRKKTISSYNDICAMCIKVKNHVIAWYPNKMMKGVVHISNGRWSSSFFPESFSIPTIFSDQNYDCSNVLDLRNPQEQVKNAFCSKKLICLFTVLFFPSLHCVKHPTIHLHLIFRYLVQKIQFEIEKKSSSSKLIFQTRNYKNQVEMDKGKGYV